MLTRKSSTASDGGSSCTQFHARPMPDFSKVRGVPPKRTRPLTDPQSPAIKRCRMGSPKSEKKNSSFVAAPVPNFDKVFKVRYPDRPLLIPTPFSFEERERNKKAQKEAGKGVFMFNARQMPNYAKTGLPPRAAPPALQSEPFNLRTDARGEIYSARFKQEVEEKERQEKLQRQFRAKTDISSILYGKPFVPEKSNRPALTVDSFVLRTELRSQERSKYDGQRYHRTCLLEAANAQRTALREAEEAKQVAEYRKSLIHKPQPIGSPFLVQAGPSKTSLSPLYQSNYGSQH